jgi:hypothetical protein
MEKFHTKELIMVRVMRHPDMSEEVKEESLCALIQSLKENNSLEILDLSEC